MLLHTSVFIYLRYTYALVTLMLIFYTLNCNYMFWYENKCNYYRTQRDYMKSNLVYVNVWN
jgi:hypothetical protein